MARPAGVKTFNVTFGPAETLGTGMPLQMICSFTPATSAIWAVTGSPMIQYTEVASAPIGQNGTITLTEPDQDGFVDGTGNALKGWSYLADIQYKTADGTTVAHLSRSFTHTQAQGDVDLDILIPVSTTAGTTVLIPDTWTTQIANIHGIPAGGTAGQALTKSSGTDYAATWQTPTAPDATALTKGSIALTNDLGGTADLPALATLGAGFTGGSASQTQTYTVDTKGRVTAIATVGIQIAESQVTNLVTDLAAKATIASPTFTGVPAAPTATAGTNTTQLATCQFVTGALAGVGANPMTTLGDLIYGGTAGAQTRLVGNTTATKKFLTQTGTGTVSAAPGWNTIAEADVTNLVTDLAAKAALASPTFTGVPAAPTATAGTSTTQIATTAFAQAVGTDTATVNSIVRRDNNGGFAVPFVYGLNTPTAADNATNKAYVDAADALKAPLASPTFTGTPAAPTASAGTSTTQVATTAFVAAAILAGQGAVVGVNTQTASYTTVLADSGKVVEANSASALTFTIPPNSSVAYPVGAILNVTNINTGALTLAPGAGVTLQSPSGLRLTTQWASAALYQRAANVWVVSGFTVV